MSKMVKVLTSKLSQQELKDGDIRLRLDGQSGSGRRWQSNPTEES